MTRPLLWWIACATAACSAPDNTAKPPVMDTVATSASPFRPDSFTVHAHGHRLALQQWVDDTQLTAWLGAFQSKDVDTLKLADTHTGSVIRTYQWQHLTVKTFLPKGRSGAGWILEVDMNAPPFFVSDTLRVGDSLSQLLYVHPSVSLAQDNVSRPGNGRYLVMDNGDTRFTEFTVRKGVITRIRLFYQIP